jgi:hypothetical protein
MNRFLNFLGRTSYTLSIPFFPLTPIVKKLLSIENVIFHICTLGSIIRKISVTGSCLKQTCESTSWEFVKLLFVQFWHFWFCIRRVLKINLFLEDFGLSLTLKWRSRSNFKIEFLGQNEISFWPYVMATRTRTRQLFFKHLLLRNYNT